MRKKQSIMFLLLFSVARLVPPVMSHGLFTIIISVRGYTNMFPVTQTWIKIPRSDFQRESVLSINEMYNCLTRYVYMKILNICFNNLPNKICFITYKLPVYQNSARTDYSWIEIIIVFQLFTVRNQKNKWRFKKVTQ